MKKKKSKSAPKKKTKKKASTVKSAARSATKKLSPAKKAAPAKKKPSGVKKPSTLKKAAARSSSKPKGKSFKKAAPKKKAAPIAQKAKPIKKISPKKPLLAPSLIPTTPARTIETPAPPVATPVVPAQPVETRPGADKLSAEITENPSGQSFVITVNNHRNFFALEEMRIIARICQDASSEAEGMLKLHQWFMAFRKDVINNTQIAGASDQALASMYRSVKATYTVKR
ncbi:MAG TPA: hypothetical protein PKM65_06760 [Spirochaetota bacterium]|nr:hypothetical protein [Spirochaetota bacterium]HNT09941.1 hypothetical protein [Spirochaetota bacterium]